MKSAQRVCTIKILIKSDYWGVQPMIGGLGHSQRDINLRPWEEHANPKKGRDYIVFTHILTLLVQFTVFLICCIIVYMLFTRTSFGAGTALHFRVPAPTPGITSKICQLQLRLHTAALKTTPSPQTPCYSTDLVIHSSTIFTPTLIASASNEDVVICVNK